MIKPGYTQDSLILLLRKLKNDLCQLWEKYNIRPSKQQAQKIRTMNAVIQDLIENPHDN